MWCKKIASSQYQAENVALDACHQVTSFVAPSRPHDLDVVRDRTESSGRILEAFIEACFISSLLIWWPPGHLHDGGTLPPIQLQNRGNQPQKVRKDCTRLDQSLPRFTVSWYGYARHFTLSLLRQTWGIRRTLNAQKAVGGLRTLRTAHACENHDGIWLRVRTCH
jgi:hypothetical protein